MKKADFQNMIEQLHNADVTELTQFIDAATDLVEQKRAAERLKITDKFAEMAAKAGYSLDQLFGKHGPAKVAPKYRNTKNPSETWTGRGRQPTWLAKAIEGGAKLEDFVIKSSAAMRATAPRTEAAE